MGLPKCVCHGCVVVCWATRIGASVGVIVQPQVCKLLGTHRRDGRSLLRADRGSLKIVGAPWLLLLLLPCVRILIGQCGEGTGGGNCRDVGCTTGVAQTLV